MKPRMSARQHTCVPASFGDREYAPEPELGDECTHRRSGV